MFTYDYGLWVTDTLSKFIYPCVPREKIEDFVEENENLARQLVIVATEKNKRLCVLITDPVTLDFLEMIDGDSQFEIKWYNDLIGLSCRISKANI